MSKIKNILIVFLGLVLTVGAVSAVSMSVDELRALMADEPMELGGSTSDDWNVGGNLSVTGSATIGTSLSASDLTASDDLTVTDDANVNGVFTYGTSVYASSTTLNAETLTESVLLAYSSMDYTPGDLAVTLTLPATSTMTTFIATAGECVDFRFRNLDATAATSTTIAAGTGIDLVENENGDVVIEGGNEAQLKFCREADTDVTVYVDEYIAAD